ncbi:MAG TPA: hypothetical protein VI959_00740 [Alphaproteobacteria bacterium]|nr:hypothetical protein [Alphaproteobacteria bacterium]
MKKRFQEALKKVVAKYALREYMKNVIQMAILPVFEKLYHCKVHSPPSVAIPSVL